MAHHKRDFAARLWEPFVHPVPTRVGYQGSLNLLWPCRKPGDPALAVPMREGTFVTHKAGGMLWNGAKDEDTTVIVIGEGPAIEATAQ